MEMSKANYNIEFTTIALSFVKKEVYVVLNKKSDKGIVCVKTTKTIKQNNTSIIQRFLCMIFACLFIFTAVMSVTMAFVLPFQHRTNEFRGQGEPTTPYSALLEKFEQLPDGTNTTIRIPGALFRLYRVNGDGTSTALTGILTTNQNGQILVQGLEPGEYYFYEIAPAPGFTFALDSGGNPIQRFYFTIVESGTTSRVVVTAYNVRLDTQPNTGNLLVTKQVIGNDNSTTDFEFTAVITLPQGTELPIFVYINGVETELDSSLVHTFTFTLQHNGQWSLQGLPVGTQFVVTETPHPDYFAAILEYAGQIAIGGITVPAPFINVYDYDEDEDGSLVISKTVPGVNTTDFYFTLTLTFPAGTQFPLDIYIGGVAVTIYGDQITSNELPQNDANDNDNDHELDENDAIYDSDNDELDSNDEEVEPGEDLNDINDEPEYTAPEVDENDETYETDESANDYSSDDEFHGRTYYTLLVPFSSPYVHTHTFSLQSGQSLTITGLPHGTLWHVFEHPATGYRPTIIDVNGTIVGNVEIQVNFVNHREPVYIDIPGTKLWVNPNNVTLPSEIIVDLFANGVLVRTLVVTAATNWDFVFENLLRYDIYGVAITYTVVERNIAGWSQNVVGNIDDGFEITNTSIPNLISVTVTKVWNDNNNPNRPTSVQVQLLRFGIAYGAPVTLNDGNGWMHTWFGLNENYTWTVEELNVPAGYTAQVTGSVTNGFTITNTYEDDPDPNLINVRVTKVWDDGDYVGRPTSVQVQLLRNGTAHGAPITLNAANNWTHVWANLDDSYTWTVDELNVPLGYTAVITGNVANGFVITNTRPIGGVVLIEGRKTWDHGTNPVANRPTYIVVLVQVNGNTVMQRRVTAQDHWQWAFVMPRYDANGNEIVYTISELPVPGYTMVVNGFDITNIHSSVTEERPPAPQTGDNARLVLWITLMIFSFVGMAVTFTKIRRANLVDGGDDYVGKFL